MDKLAIVIPAFKHMFFNKTLQSIADQSCKDFTLYIGDDASPYDIKSIVDMYRDQISIVYKRFSKNLGGKDLVAHWERCIDLAKDEEWIWLFSDDDLMDTSCVENFYATLYKSKNFDLFHFNVKHIDEGRNINRKITDFPDVLNSEEFFSRNLKGDYSFVVEYVFRKSHFYKMGRFQNFDLAWYSDTATWIKLADEKGIKNIGNAYVYFRTSPYSITPNYKDRNTIKRKFYSQIKYAKWINDQVKQKKINLKNVQLDKKLGLWFYKTIKGKIEYIPNGLIWELMFRFNKTLDNNEIMINKIIFLYFFKFYRKIISLIKIIFVYYNRTLNI